MQSQLPVFLFTGAVAVAANAAVIVAAAVAVAVAAPVDILVAAAVAAAITVAITVAVTVGIAVAVGLLQLFDAVASLRRWPTAIPVFGFVYNTRFTVQVQSD